MKVSIRQQVFETNSSSVHSCSICTVDTYKKFNDGKVWIRQSWNDEDSYLPVDEAIEYNINALKAKLPEYDFSEEDMNKIFEAYRKGHDLYEAFYLVDEGDWFEDMKYDLELDEMYMSSDNYWDYHQYEDWSHGFKDSAGVDMVAWGYCGHD